MAVNLVLGAVIVILLALGWLFGWWHLDEPKPAPAHHHQVQQ